MDGFRSFPTSPMSNDLHQLSSATIISHPSYLLDRFPPVPLLTSAPLIDIVYRVKRSCILRMFRSGCRPEAYSPPPLIPSRESGLDVIKIRPSQLKSVSRRLKDYVVTETPPSPVAMTSLSEDSGGEHERTVASRTVSKLEETSSPSETTKYRTTPPSGESKPEQDPVVRASCFADTLARMEGRVPRIPLSPIVRYVRSERVYKDNVELEHDSPVLECPRPVNGAIGARMDRLLQVGTVDSSDELELHDSETPDWLSERPMNPTPERAIFHNDEATTPISIAI